MKTGPNGTIDFCKECENELELTAVGRLAHKSF